MSSSEGIPIRRLVVNDPKDIPLNYGETPGGSIFSTTPGGSRIYYDRAFLLSRRESPMTRSPPCNLPFIPEVTLIPKPTTSESLINNASEKSTSMKKGGDDQFAMDM